MCVWVRKCTGRHIHTHIHAQKCRQLHKHIPMHTCTHMCLCPPLPGSPLQQQNPPPISDNPDINPTELWVPGFGQHSAHTWATALPSTHPASMAGRDHRRANPIHTKP